MLGDSRFYWKYDAEKLLLHNEKKYIRYLHYIRKDGTHIQQKVEINEETAIGGEFLPFFAFSFIIGLLYHYKNKERLFFLAYFFSGIVLFTHNTVVIACKILTGRQLVINQEVANTLFELTEFLALYHFFNKCLQNNNHKKYLKISLYILLISIVIFFIRLS